MPTRTEIEGRVSRIVSIFQQAMPPLSVPYPSVTVVNKRTYCDIRALLVARTGSSMVAAPAEDYSVELLTGSKGNAVIVRKEEVRSLDHLYHALWTILGRFYMIATQPSASDAPTTPATPTTPDQQPTTPDQPGEAVQGEAGQQAEEKPRGLEQKDKEAAQELATDFWTVFAPEAISFRVEHYLVSKARKDNGPIEWKETEWRSIADELHIQLMKVYGQRGIVVSELAILLSSALADDLLVDIIEKARAGILPGKGEEAFDPVGIDKMPETMQCPMRELVGVLEMQLKKEHFWVADAGTMAQIGEMLTRMNERYVDLIADHILLDELDAMEIPKVIPEEWDDLPEID